MRKIPKVILIIDTRRAYGRGIARGVAQYVRLHGPWLFYRMTHEDYKASVTQLTHMRTWGADGIIARLTNSKEGRQIIAMGLPTIAVDTKEPIPNIPNIITDDAAIGKMAAEHLLSHGFQHFAFCGFDRMDWSRGRAKSFTKRIAEAGFETHFYKKPKSRAQRLCSNEQVFMADWLKSLPKPVGLMACNDLRARDVIEAHKIAGVHVPEELAVIGVDNDDVFCDLSCPQLSSVALNTKRAGYEAAELLDKLMAGKKMRIQTVIVRPTNIVIRQSTDILAIEDREVARAMHFIREHSRERICVADVVNEVVMSRRNLQQRFRKILGRSIFDEIRRVRTEMVARMLVETNLSVMQIALELNYVSPEHVARSFQQEKGMSPTAYRKKYGPKQPETSTIL